MPLIKESNSFTKEIKKAPEDFASQQIPKTSSLNSSPTPENKGLVSIVGSLLPLAPVLFEQWTGQKIPPMTGTLAEMNNSLSQLSLALTQILNNQQQLWTKLEQLEKTSQSSLSHLTSQFQNIRLAHTREKREIEYGPKEPTEEY